MSREILAIILLLALIQSIELWFIIEINFFKLSDKSVSACPQRRTERRSQYYLRDQIIHRSSYPQAHPRSHQPIKRPSPQAQRSMRACNYASELKQQNPEKQTPCLVPSRSDPGDLYLLCPGVKPTKMCHQEQPSQSPFGLSMVALQWCATHDGMRGKGISGLHQAYNEIFRGGSEGGKREELG